MSKTQTWPTQDVLYCPDLVSKAEPAGDALVAVANLGE